MREVCVCLCIDHHQLNYIHLVYDRDSIIGIQRPYDVRTLYCGFDMRELIYSFFIYTYVCCFFICTL